jgi:hypothetical protein
MKATTLKSSSAFTLALSRRREGNIWLRWNHANGFGLATRFVDMEFLGII